MTPLIVLPGLDGTTTYFRHVAKHLSRPLIHCDAPGVFDGAPLDTVEALARSIMPTAMAASTETVDLVGWSFGSMIAHHLTWLLEPARTVRLFAIDPLWIGRRAGQQPTAVVDTTPAQAASRRALRRYRPRAIRSQALYLLAEDRQVDAAALSLLAHGRTWDTVSIDGDHFSCLSAEHAVSVARHLAAP